MDHLVRHLSPPKVVNAPLLDIGCGNGAFLQIAKALGYAPAGLEPDESAAQKGKEAGLDVRSGGLPGSGLPEAYFEQITLSHVFEHLHRPREAAEEIFRLLQPGGRVWFSQPNLDSAGLKLFGQCWRGLEPPRHLSLYGAEDFTKLLKKAGFEKIKLLLPPREAEYYFRSSLAINNDVDPFTNERPRGWNAQWQKRSRKADRDAYKFPAHAESLTVIAFRPS